MKEIQLWMPSGAALTHLENMQEWHKYFLDMCLIICHEMSVCYAAKHNSLPFRNCKDVLIKVNPIKYSYYYRFKGKRFYVFNGLNLPDLYIWL